MRYINLSFIYLFIYLFTYYLHCQVPPGASSSGHVPARLIVTCLTIATVFTLCWTPMKLAVLLSISGLRYISYAGMVRWLSVLACFNSCVNPVIYGIMWRPFRTALADVSIGYVQTCVFFV